MLRLALDICANRGSPRFADRERPVPGLPLKSVWPFRLLIQPLRRLGLESLDHLRDRYIRFEPGQDVYMVRHAPDLEETAPLASGDSADVLVEALPEVVRDQRT